jgi:hypothetical protein
VRDEPITVEEGHQLGLRAALELARGRELARADSRELARAGMPPGCNIDALIQNVFQLSPDV